jgi:V8-like Glu-specific endopeptidase
MEIDSSEVKTHLKMFNYENTDDFKVQDVEKFPNRHICFVQIKIYNGENLMGNSKRSGVLIDQKYLLTAAHNFKKYGELT